MHTIIVLNTVQCNQDMSNNNLKESVVFSSHIIFGSMLDDSYIKNNAFISLN